MHPISVIESLQDAKDGNAPVQPDALSPRDTTEGEDDKNKQSLDQTHAASPEETHKMIIHTRQRGNLFMS